MLIAPELIFGSLHNNTAIDATLLRGKKPVETKTLVRGEDLPSDHLPVEVVWGKNYVVVREPWKGDTVRFDIPGDGA
jgi:hypothetical protein